MERRYTVPGVDAIHRDVGMCPLPWGKLFCRKRCYVEIMELDVIILAGGKGSRMNADIPKPLRTVGGRPTLERILASILLICERPIIVVGDRASEIMDIGGKNCRYITQTEQRGTGHAVACVKKSMAEDLLGENLIVLPGDHPLIDAQTIAGLSQSHLESHAVLTLSTLVVPDFRKDNQLFSNYGRIRRNSNGSVTSIVEVKDATKEEREITEVNVSYYCFRTAWLWENIDKLTNRNAAGEFYLTDLVGIAIAENARTNVYTLKDPKQGMGFNTPEQLEIIRNLCC
jgi:bifunctional UDP-N-acetylglucosamine pyrophosphorylase/glucosamine-1-phosphate N-acetyltransferase